MANYSFEGPGPGAGFAANWNLAHVSEEADSFGFNGEVDYAPSEGFESRWRLPRIISGKMNESALFSFVIFTEHGTGDSLSAVTVDLQTLTDADAAFTSNMVGHNVVVVDATNTTNNGTFEIVSVLSSTQLVFRNASGVAETSVFRWHISSAELVTATFTGDEEETFEAAWDLQYLLGLTYAEQSVQITTDGGTWPVGHATFIASFSVDILDVFDFNSTTEELDGFENNWLLPGTIAGATNDAWFDAYHDGTNYRFLPAHLATFTFDGSLTIDGFETLWKDNQDSKFAFVPADIEAITFDIGGSPEVAEEFNDADWVLDFDA